MISIFIIDPPEPSNMAELGSFTSWLTGLITATGSVFWFPVYSGSN
jgi:hypothetical protein